MVKNYNKTSYSLIKIDKSSNIKKRTKIKNTVTKNTDSF